jgi:hypothetical protein
VDILQEFLKAWGPPGLVAVILWIFLYKSENREKAKDARIQLLENQLIESYDERIEAADRIGDAIHGSAIAANNAARALESLAAEVRSKQ